jgi:hypothetical protein
MIVELRFDSSYFPFIFSTAKINVSKKLNNWQSVIKILNVGRNKISLIQIMKNIKIFEISVYLYNESKKILEGWNY